MVAKVNELLKDIQIGEPLRYERLTVIPLVSERPSKLEYLVLDEATEKGLVEVTESREGGSVPEMLVRNRAKEPLFIPDGTALVGSKQNRVVNLSILLAAESETVIPVSCVEQGRWHRATSSSSPEEYCDKEIRAKMCFDASESLKHRGKVSVDQGAVWNLVECALHSSKTESPSRSYHEMFKNAKGRLEEYEQNLPCPEGASGVAVAIDGKIEAVDLYDKPKTLQKLWPTVLRGYATGAIYDLGSRGKDESVGEYLKALEQSEHDLFEPVGIGTTLRLSARESVGAALLHEDTMVHLSSFAKAM